MKKYILSFLAVATSLLSAQNGGNTQQGNWLIEVNTNTPTVLGGGHQYSGLGNTGANYYSSDEGTKTISTWSIGLEGGYYIMDNLALKAGLAYNDIDAQNKNESPTQKADYISYKLGAKYYALGVIPLSLDYTGVSNVTNYNQVDSKGKAVKKANAAPSYFSAGIGYAFFPANNISVEPFLKYSLDLSDNKKNILAGGLGFVLHLGKAPVVVATDPCSKGDADNDGVCDNWDQQLLTPAGAPVDEAGVAKDTDFDGIIDLNDECVNTPGVASNNGCPAKITCDTSELSRTIKGIEFDLGKAAIRPSSYYKLDKAADILKNCPDGNFYVEGHTDSRGSASMNQSLSERRAIAVANYLESKGVQAGRVTPVGRGEAALLYPECNPATNCPEYKNEANRRVIFVVK